LAGEALGEPKTADGAAEMVRVLRVARTSLVRARAKAYTALQSLLVTAPSALREQLAGLYKDRLLQACLQLDEPEIPVTPIDAITMAIRSLAARCRQLDTEAARLEHHIDTITATTAPQLRALYGVGPDTAATLLSAIGDNAHRIPNEAAFAKLCGVCPLEASSGKTIRHRLNRGGNRDANRALHVIPVVRLRRHQPTRDYMARRTAEGKSKNEVMRCLKRYIAREVFHALQPPPTGAKTIAATWIGYQALPLDAVETQNSFCSGSDILTHRVPPKLCTPSSMRRAPSACSRWTSRSTSSTTMSRCMRFLPALGSGTP
jgi:transposase